MKGAPWINVCACVPTRTVRVVCGSELSGAHQGLILFFFNLRILSSFSVVFIQLNFASGTARGIE